MGFFGTDLAEGQDLYYVLKTFFPPIGAHRLALATPENCGVPSNATDGVSHIFSP